MGLQFSYPICFNVCFKNSNNVMFKISIFLHPVYLLPFITIFTAITAFPVSASETKVIISKKDCGQLIHHQFYRDIDFEPGIDVRGKKVKSVEYFGAEKLT